MQIKEKIYKEIDRLPIDQLTLLYEQINTMKKASPLKDKVKSRWEHPQFLTEIGGSEGMG